MSLDPRNQPTTSDGLQSQRVADLERRVAMLERATSVTTLTVAPTAPVSTTTTASSGTVQNVTAQQPRVGSMIIVAGLSRAYLWDGAAWKYVSLT